MEKHQKSNVSRWLSEPSSLPLEKITYTIKHQQHNFHQILDPFICYVLRTDLSHVMEEAGDIAVPNIAEIFVLFFFFIYIK